ncbi:hypothetical protein GQ457_05G004610 [Hibiscus cannabinus]
MNGGASRRRRCKRLAPNDLKKKEGKWRPYLDSEHYALLQLKESFVLNRSASASTSSYPKFDSWKLQLQGPIQNHFIVQDDIVDSCVADWLSSSGGWDWSRLKQVLPIGVLHHIATIPPPNASFGTDLPCWRWEHKQLFTTRSAYASLGNSSCHSSKVWKLIWTLSVPQRIRTFVWLAVHGKLLTNQERMRRHLSTTASCSLCNNASKYVLHVLRDCVRARTIWFQVIHRRKLADFNSLPLHEWFTCALSESDDYFKDGDDKAAKFAIICWILWNRRYKCLFDVDYKGSEPILVECSRMLAILRAKRVSMFAHIKSHNYWVPPQPGWVTTNVDGDVWLSDSTAACGGLIRDENHNWIIGFTRSLGCCPVLFAELWGVHDALKHAWSLGHRRLVIETDNVEVVDILEGNSGSLQSNTLVSAIQYMLHLEWDV